MISCLACKRLRRSDFDDLEPLDPRRERVSSVAQRNWSGCLVCVPIERPRGVSPCSEPMDSSKRLRKLASLSVADMEANGAAEAAARGNEPRLMRSGGMRRNWSFEDLKKSVLVVST